MMKKPFLVLSLCGLYLLSVAQISKGNFLLNGTASAGYTKTASLSNTGFTLSHEIGYMLSDRWLLGGGIALGITSLEEGSYAGISSLLRYYFKKKENKAWFLTNSLSTLNQIWGVETGLGLSLALTPSIVVETIVSYYYLSPAEDMAASRMMIGSKLKFFLNQQAQEGEKAWSPAAAKSSWMIGGSHANISYTDELFDFHLAPNIGIFLSDRFLLGGQVGLGFQKKINRNHKNLSLNLAPFFRYYFSPLTSRTMGFLEGGAGFSYSSTQVENANFSFTQATYFGAIGMDIFIAPTVAFEVKGLYDSFGMDSKQLALIFGIQFFLQ